MNRNIIILAFICLSIGRYNCDGSTTTTTLRPIIVNTSKIQADDQITTTESSHSTTTTIAPLTTGSISLNSQQATTDSTPSTTTMSPTTTTDKKAKMFSIMNTIKIGDDFKPMYKGKVISRNELNLTDEAKMVAPEPDYYAPGEGPASDDDEDLDVDVPGNTDEHMPSTSKTTTTTISPHSNDGDEETEEDDEGDSSEPVNMAVGGLAGIVDKLLAGPQDNEITDKSKPEDVYVYLSGVVHDEMGKAMKAILPKVYDYQYPIGDLVSQRCFNSLLRFGEQWRKHYIWPYRMVGSNGRIFNHFALRDYGDFDNCLNIVADDEERRSNEILFTGQYCMVQVLLPLPLLNNTMLSYHQKIFNFTNTPVQGTFTEFFLLNAPFLYSNPISLGVCLPSTCLPKEVEDVSDYFLKKFRIKVQFTSDCYSRLNMTVQALPDDLSELDLDKIKQMQSFSLWSFISQLTKSQVFAILYIVISIILVVGATIFEIYHLYTNNFQWKSEERNRPKSFIACFSIRHNLEQIFQVPRKYRNHISKDTNNNNSNNNNVNQIDCLNIDQNSRREPETMNTGCLDTIKTISLFWICMSNYYLLGYQSQMLSSLPHARELLLSLRTSFLFQPVIQSWLANEIFFLISGFLLAYTALPLIARHDGQPKLSFFFGKRCVRVVPSVIFILLVVNLLPLWQNAGPIYNTSIEKILQPCERYSWRSFLFLANFYEMNEVCLPYLWYISNEIHLFLFGIFVLVFAYNRYRHAFKTFGLLIAIGMFMSGVIVYRMKLNLKTLIHENAILEQIPIMIRTLHFNTIVHFSSYFSGMALGYYIRMQPLQQSGQKRKLFNFTLPIRIVLAIALVFLSSSIVIYIPLLMAYLEPMINRSRPLLVIYYTFARILFVLSSLWIISQCLPRRNVITKVLSWSIFRICSHISYQIYLFNLILIWIYFFTKRTLLETNIMESFPVGLSLFLMTCALGVFTYLVFEAPYRSLYRYYFESPKIIITSTTNFKNGKLDRSGNEMNDFAKDINSNMSNFIFSPQYNQYEKSISQSSSLNNVNDHIEIQSLTKPKNQNSGTNKTCYVNTAVTIE